MFPGSFDPLTVAHLAIADAVVAELDVLRVDLVVSTVPLAKEHLDQSPASQRIAHIRRHATDRPWLDAAVTQHQLLADIAEGYDVLVVGADKWHQLFDVAFYGGSKARRDESLARLPRVAVAPRSGVPVPTSADVHVLDVHPSLHEVSSTAVRSGRTDWRA